MSRVLGACVDCLRAGRGLEQPQRVHYASRQEFGLPIRPPSSPGGLECPLCANRCRLGPNDTGYCGLRRNREGRLVHLAGTARTGLLSWYYDPLPTNCVADWVCTGSQQLGKKNLAVFYSACSFNCLFCQNWHYRDRRGAQRLSASQLAERADPTTYCVCFFGGDPTPQMPHALAVAQALVERVRICWETNGSMHPRLLRRAVGLSLASGGCVKFDLKAFDPRLHLALTGTSNRQTLENFALAARWIPKRPSPPPLVASTLLVPGYVDVAEVERLARFIAGLDSRIPYALLAFYPSFCLTDLPRTSRQHAEECLQAARRAGLEDVRLGNRHLLSADY